MNKDKKSKAQQPASLTTMPRIRCTRCSGLAVAAPHTRNTYICPKCGAQFKVSAM